MSTTPKKAKFCDLKVDRDLLDPKFEGYKLCLDQLRTEFRQLPTGLKAVSPSVDQWSYQHLRFFGGHNHLHVNSWSIGQHRRSTYLVLSDGVYILPIEREKRTVAEPRKVLDVTFPSEDRTDKFNVSVAFPSPDMSILADGCGNLILCETGGENEVWKVVQRFDDLCDGKSFVVLDSRGRQSPADHSVDVLLAHVEEVDNRNSTGGGTAVFTTVLEWVVLKKAVDSAAYSVGRRRRLQTKGNLEYAALSTDCSAICCLTSEPIRFIYDSEKSVDDVEVEESREDKPKQYSWGQTSDQLCVVFTLGSKISKNDIVWKLASESIFVAIDQEPAAQRVLLEGDLHLPVDVEGSTWTLDEGRLEITLSKRDKGRMWPEVVNGDSGGEYVADPDLVKEVSERLMHFTSDGENPTVDVSKAPFNVQQLEECDAVDADASYLSWLDGESHSPTIEADTGGHQWLFSVRMNAERLPYICLRHDVDGILWRVADAPSIDSNQPSYWFHEYTFNAFGYVQAGKPDRKFCTCSTDGSYAVVVDCTRHAYIYWQPSAVDTDLRNRKTGQRVSKVAKQQLVSITASGSENGKDGISMDMLGVAAFDDVLLLLTENRLIGVFLK